MKLNIKKMGTCDGFMKTINDGINEYAKIHMDFPTHLIIYAPLCRGMLSTESMTVLYRSIDLSKLEIMGLKILLVEEEIAEVIKVVK